MARVSPRRRRQLARTLAVLVMFVFALQSWLLGPDEALLVCLRIVAALSLIAADVREAAKARSAERSVTAFAVPFLIRTLRHADELGEALAARRRRPCQLGILVYPPQIRRKLLS